MPKQATLVKLSEKEQKELEQITKRHRSEQQQALRARIVLEAAQGHSNVQIACDLAINVDTVRLWRDRWMSLQGFDVDTLSIVDVCKTHLDQALRRGLPVLATWAIHSKRACLTTTTQPFKRRLCERMAHVASTGCSPHPPRSPGPPGRAATPFGPRRAPGCP
jgi:Helix-turn-helix domain